MLTFLAAVLLLAADVPDLSGTYTGHNKSRLEVTQIATEIKIVQTADGKDTANTFKLDGTATPYVTASGVQGTATARFKGRTLHTESTVKIRPQPNAPVVTIVMKEQWSISKDGKTVTVRSKPDFPGAAPEVAAALDLGTTSVTYRRN